MKRISFPLLLLALLASVWACTPAEFVLKRPPAKPSSEEFPKADAVYRLKHVRIQISGDGYSFEEHQHIQIKVLTRLGLKVFGRVSAAFRAPHTRISDFHARVLCGGEWISQPRPSIYQRPAAVGRRLRRSVADGHVKSIRLSRGRIGGLLEYRYTRSGSTWFLTRRFLQEKYPIAKGILEIAVPSGVGFRAKHYLPLGKPGNVRIKYSRLSRGSQTLHRWEVGNMPAYQTQAKGPHAIARSARVVLAADSFRYDDKIGSQKSWKALASFYNRLNGPAARPTSAIQEWTKKLTKDASSTHDKIERILAFVQRKINRVPMPVGLGLWKAQTADDTLKRRLGDAKAKAALMIAMLATLNIKAHPVLVRTRSMGPLDRSMPCNAFNYVMVQVPSARRTFDVNGTSGLGHLANSDARGAQGLLVTGSGGRLVTVPPGGSNYRSYAWTFHLQPKQKQMVGTLNIKLQGAHIVSWARLAEKKSLEKKKARMAKAQSLLRPLSSLKFRMAFGLGKVKPTDMTFKFPNRREVQVTVSFSAPFGKRGARNRIWYPFRRHAKGYPSASIFRERKFEPILNGKDGTFVDTVVFKGWSALEYPQPLSIKSKHVRYKVRCVKGQMKLSCRRFLRTRLDQVEIADLPELRKAFSQLRERDTSLIVLKKGALDKDKDGVADDVDRCPTIPGPAKFKGCPDTDKDGIPNPDDKCPFVPGLPNTKDPSKHGCPKVILVKVTEKEIKILQKIFFRTGRATILRKSFQVLDQVILVLKSKPKIRVQIEGHTDNQGRPKSNKRLSQRRATSVFKYFVKKGIDKARLVAKGFGQDKPIDSNKTRKGRAKNRRVQFKIIKDKP